MKRVIIAAIVFTAGIVSVNIDTTFAQVTKPKDLELTKKTAEINTNIKVVRGKLVCIGCTLKKRDGAAAACSIFGHKHGLQTPDESIYSFCRK